MKMDTINMWSVNILLDEPQTTYSYVAEGERVALSTGGMVLMIADTTVTNPTKIQLFMVPTEVKMYDDDIPVFISHTKDETNSQTLLTLTEEGVLFAVGNIFSPPMMFLDLLKNIIE